MDNKIFLFYVIAGFAAVSFIMNIFLSRLVVDRNKRLLRLEKEQIKTTAIVTKILRQRGIAVRYEFESMNGKMEGYQPQFSNPPKIYSVGDRVEIVYLPDYPKTNSIRELLEPSLKQANSAIKIFGFLPLQGLIVMVILLGFMINQHIVQLPF